VQKTIIDFISKPEKIWQLQVISEQANSFIKRLIRVCRTNNRRTWPGRNFDGISKWRWRKANEWEKLFYSSSCLLLL